jgi:putative acetyltransferase
MTLIRSENPEDIPAIRIVNERAFGRPAEADLVDALRRNGKTLVSLVAEVNGSVVGHILFSPVTIETEAQKFLGVGLAPLAVLPEFQNRGVGSLLVEYGLEQCRAAGHSFVVVLGHANYYPRFGFTKASRFGIKCEYEVAEDHFMAIELHEGVLQNRTGIARYQSEFNEV